jgi:hypothetical protein
MLPLAGPAELGQHTRSRRLSLTQAKGLSDVDELSDIAVRPRW